MKKWIALLLACVLCLSICGCGAQADIEDPTESVESTEPTEKFDWSLNGSSNSGCAMDEGITE